jgi:phosphate transport system protein
MVDHHTAKAFDIDLQDLARMVAEMGGLAEKQIADAVDALAKRDARLAQRVAALDPTIDALQREIEERGILTIARRQPMAVDLREIVGALRVSNDLERIGDLAVNIAERAIDLNQSAPLRPLHDLVKLAELCKKQVHRALDAFVEAEADEAAAVIKDDELVDALYHTLFNELIGLMMEDSKNIRRASSLMFVAKHLERLADHATNVAEMVIFMVKGTDVRHPHSRGLVAEK